ncbi:thiamine ABC transporter substrate-binding protein [Deinococcus cellulosilyticus]|uniref:ABC transporter substrate-binding protein n=1 Tax=Deinococcus cellulosilyticus (strain DSM 18568 / NBRC 106333 / KACC 11606 / 5516J-15) TaxID=1223518 RepID=A0A511N5B7_DEIC1|nr:thiamine ABC transporter substrate-binding protein [Deinococcus cellulosilyticus]GEM47678.1 ABC transporter substrate-binding protein [Deinococcus cellulosilyticus NBRC 106333 = KACC 11606]
MRKTLLFTLSLLATAQAAELRVVTHSSFNLDKKLLAKFEQDNGVKLQFIEAGDAGEMVSKLILTRSAPIADVVYGIDNTLLSRALDADILAPYQSPALKNVPKKYLLNGAFNPIDYGHVALNIDKAYFQKNKLALPKTLKDLLKPEYKNLLVVENPATSSPGLAFLLATIKELGEKGAYSFWAGLRDNGVKVARGWDDAYYTEFSKNGGSRPIVVSYSSSPAAEVFYAEKKPQSSPTANLFLPGSTFLQVEGAALIKGGKNVEMAKKFIDFLLSKEAQSDIPTQMWVYPVIPGIKLDATYRYAATPVYTKTLTPKEIAAGQQKWVENWSKVVLRNADPKDL